MAIDQRDLEQKVKALELPTKDFVIFGSAPLLICGLVARINDIDIVARATAWEKAKSLGKVVQGEKGDRLVKLGDIDIYDGWMGEDVKGLIDRASHVNGLAYASLEDVLRYKQKLNRIKDAKHINLIKNYLNSC
ncbi:MAG: hypothetical protein KC422_23840 [Trueperaceae bacterium]|nr:hypothetical protein [Trueperaceae bacterium]